MQPIACGVHFGDKLLSVTLLYPAKLKENRCALEVVSKGKGNRLKRLPLRARAAVLSTNEK